MHTCPCLRYLFLAAKSSNTGNLSSEPVETKHDDVIKWKHFLRNWSFVQGIRRSPVNSPHKGQWRGALMFCLICAWINGWVNNREAGDLRLHRAHHDVTVLRAVIENCRHCVRYISIIFRVAHYQLSRMMSHLMTERIFIFHLIIIIKSEGWTHGRCGRSGPRQCRLYSNISQILLLYKIWGYYNQIWLYEIIHDWRYIIDMSKFHNAGIWSMDKNILCLMFKNI